MTQAHIFYKGVVQGVGFRFSVQRMAQSLGLRGWVKNLDDGRVEVLVQGEKNDTTQLMEKIQLRFQGYINDVQIDYQPATELPQGFDIHY